MGTEYSFGALFMQTPDGSYQRVMDVGIFKDITQHQPIHEIRTDMDVTFTGTFSMSRQTRKRIINGWRAKGPVRERAIQRARSTMFKMSLSCQFCHVRDKDKRQEKKRKDKRKEKNQKKRE